jgi:valyl-tRNA synthetase
MMRTELPKSYTPSEAEDEIRAKWDAAKAFHAEPGDGREPYCILIPPPNVTAALHLGHAFNNTLQDVLIRYHRMRGCNTLWMPGTDHAGIATQTVVEKRLMQEGKKRTDFTREEFIARVQAWKDEYEATIIEQLRAMGASCDFERTRFTMDEMCSKAVREAFFQLFKDGLIYRGKRLVNWDPVTLTALADDEVEMREVDGHFWYLRYPLVHDDTNEKVTWSELAARGYPGADQHGEDERAWVTVATTRPETYLGDTAVAVNPKDPRAAALRGLFAQLPLVGRVIPIIEDDYVVMPDPDSPDAKAQYATGFLKVTPAHDPNDYEIGQRHDLPLVNVMAPDAMISDQHGWDDIGDAHLFVGKSREEARKLVVKEFEARGLLAAVKPYRHSVGHSYRSHVPIEPYLSDQWYVHVTDESMRGEALRAMADEQYEGERPRRDHIAPGLPGVDAASPEDRTPTPAKAGAICEREGDGELHFFPERYAKTFQQWHENLRDWCISRQLWWGHRIPVWAQFDAVVDYADDYDEQMLKYLRDQRITVSGAFSIEESLERDRLGATSPTGSYFCVRSENDHEVIMFLEQHGFTQDPDILDTWFSSGLWPLSTMGWPDPDAFPETRDLLDTFNPSSVLCTGRDIITLWVSRMVMFNRYLRDGTLPFRDVYIHPMIQDGHGQRMSKSLGNGVDPRDIIHGHGADAMRYSLTKLATTTQDARLPVDMVCPAPGCGEAFAPKEITTPAGHRVAAPEQKCPKCERKMVSGYGAASGRAAPSDDTPLARNTSRKFDEGRNFANKLWNAARFALSNLAGDHRREDAAARADLSLADRWILARLHRTLSAVNAAVKEYQFHLYAEAMYDFIWRDFCDWYLEAIKPTVRGDSAQQQVLHTTLDAILRMLHPIMPFVTEALWPHVAAARGSAVPGIDLPPSDLLAVAQWPQVDDRWDDAQAVADFSRAQQLVEAIRRIRGERNIPRTARLRLHATPKTIALIEQAGGVVETLALLDSIDTGGEHLARTGAVPVAFEGEDLLLGGVGEAAGVDPVAERARLLRFIAEKERAVGGYRQKLGNSKYLEKAPPAVVEDTRARLSESEADLAAAKRALESLTEQVR